MATKVSSIKKIDKITALNHITGTYNLASGAILTIGGLQYTTDAVKSVTPSGLAGTQRYQIYAVISAGDVILVVSTNENSVGPAGSTSWKLVGCFYTDGMSSVGFGAFMNIKGIPKTDRRIQYLGQIVDGNNASVISAAPITNAYYWERSGQQGLYAGGYYQSATVGINGSGPYYYIKPPAGHVFIQDLLGAGNTGSGIGHAQGDVGGATFMQGSRGGVVSSPFNGVSLRGLTNVAGGSVDGGNWGPAAGGGTIDPFAMNVVNMGMTWERIAVTVSGFADTPIEDL